MPTHAQFHKRYKRSAEKESDANLKALLHAHQTLPNWKRGGGYHKQARYRIWMLQVRLEARKRGLI